MSVIIARFSKSVCVHAHHLKLKTFPYFVLILYMAAALESLQHVRITLHCIKLFWQRWELGLR